MKQQSWLMFLKYPYSTAVLACFWIGSAIMLFIDKDLPILPIIITDIISSWIISWLSFRSSVIK
ncbi:MAG: hypothetical protein PHX34_00990 [Candidatus Shapirobacteria bacterium]|nr:hypothetical protein [Candidatus Shapirobacteria bacterium]